ncbi:S-adenosyl-L-methionine-dependent methyltransferase [Byssothecium circinans]|uniref:S-adenosyl-L-methionine-dependent methyltransferase n=1 Tax=Byssothecium circinans TaxID=147558 RepID=A0A6A5U3D5_9PLEO|nr:S-adenosyl-L-methionine-dependent methyltransferase [Byssothecium circinans]
MGHLVDLAQQILHHAQTLESQLADASSPLPSFEAGGPAVYPKASEHPEIFNTRSALTDASRELYQLALGPGDSLRSIIGPEKLQAFTLNAIDRLEICSHVPAFPGTIAIQDLARKVGIESEILERLLRFAASFNLFKFVDGKVQNTALSETLPLLSNWTRLINRKEFSCAFSAWPEAMKLYKEGSASPVYPWNVGNGMATSFFEYLTAEKDGMKNFGAALQDHAKITGVDTSYIVKGFDWASLGSGLVVDVGGGTGHVSTMLAEEFPDLKFVVQDLEASKDAATAQITSRGFVDRISFQVQDFFEPQPPSSYDAKVFLLRAIVHDWRDEECAKILRQLLPAVERGAKIVLCDRVAPSSREGKATHMESFTLFMDLVMFSLLGAKERSVEQWKRLVKRTDERLRVESIYQAVGSEMGLVVVGM